MAGPCSCEGGACLTRLRMVMLGMLSRPQEAEPIRARARASVHGRFGKATISRRTAELYRAVLSDQPVKELSR